MKKRQGLQKPTPTAKVKARDVKAIAEAMDGGSQKRKIEKELAKLADKALGKDYTHVVLACIHKKLPGKPIIVVSGDLLSATRLANHLARSLQYQVRQATGMGIVEDSP